MFCVFDCLIIVATFEIRGHIESILDIGKKTLHYGFC